MVIASIKEGCTRIEAEIAEAESKTSGEIVVVVARQAGHYEREASLVAFAAALVAYLASWMALEFWSRQSARSELWLIWSFAALLAGYAGGLVVAHLVPVVPMLLVSRQRRTHAVEERAAVAFHDLHVSNTRAHTGILLLVAEAERMVVVLGDGPIADRIGQEEWNGVRDRVLEGIRSRKHVDGLVAGVQRAGALLAEHFPATEAAAKDLPNSVYLIP